MPASRLLITSIKDVCIVDFADRQLRELSDIEQIGRDLYALVDERAYRKVILDFEQVQLLSSQMLSVLLILHKKLTTAKGKLVLCGLRKDLTRLFQIANLDKLFTQCPDEQQALAVFGITSAG